MSFIKIKHLFKRKKVKFEGTCPNCNRHIFTDEDDPTIFGDLHVKGFTSSYVAYTSCSKCGAKVYLTRTEKNYTVEHGVGIKPFTEIPNMDMYLNLEEIQKMFTDVFSERVFDIRFEYELDKPRDVNLNVVDKYGYMPFLVVLKYKNKLMWVRLRVDYLFNVPPRIESNGYETEYTGAKFSGAYEDDVIKAIANLRLAVIKTFGTIPSYKDILNENEGGKVDK